MTVVRSDKDMDDGVKFDINLDSKRLVVLADSLTKIFFQFVAVPAGIYAGVAVCFAWFLGWVALFPTMILGSVGVMKYIDWLKVKLNVK